MILGRTLLIYLPSAKILYFGQKGYDDGINLSLLITGGMNMKKFRSPWYYWYTGHKEIAAISIIVSFLLMCFFLVVGAGFSFWSIIFAIILDATGFWLAIIYFLFLRYNLPDFLGITGAADKFIITQIIIPVIVTFLSGRLTTFFVAKSLGYSFSNTTEQNKNPEKEKFEEEGKKQIFAENNIINKKAEEIKLKIQQKIIEQKNQRMVSDIENSSVESTSDKEIYKEASERFTKNENLIFTLLIAFSIIGFFIKWWFGLGLALLTVFYINERTEYYKKEIISEKNA